MGKERIPSCSRSPASKNMPSIRQESRPAACKLAPSEVFKVTVAVFDRSLLVFGGGGNA